VAFVQPWPEYQLLYPARRHLLDWSGLSFNGSGGLYGAAHRHGWKAAGELVTHGELPAEYATNARFPEAAWYLKRRSMCIDDAQLFVRSARSRGDRLAIERGDVPVGFSLAGRVEVNGRPSLGLFVREPPADAPRLYRLDDYGAQFDRELASPWAPIGTMYRPDIDYPPVCADGTVSRPYAP